MSELSDAQFMTVRVMLRRYCNECIRIEAQHTDGELDTPAAEKALMLLDDKYATKILKAVGLA